MLSALLLDTIKAQYIHSGRDIRYTIDAYSFVLQGIQWFYVKTGTVRHYTGRELVFGLIQLAGVHFGLLAQDTLAHWGIRCSDDFGYIVYNLIDLKLIQRQDSDSLNDFFNVVDFTTYFSENKVFTIDKNYIRLLKEA